MTVGRGNRANRIPKNIIDYTFVPHPNPEVQTVNLTYTVTPIQQSGTDFPDIRSRAPAGDSPTDGIGAARSNEDEAPDIGEIMPDSMTANGIFVTSGNNRTSFPRDTRTLQHYNAGAVYPHERADVYIQNVVYTSYDGTVLRYSAPSRALGIIDAQMVNSSTTRTNTVSVSTVDGVPQYVGTNADYCELTWECEVVTFYDADGNVVPYSGSWVRYDVSRTTQTTRVPQYTSVLMQSQIMNGASARMGRAFTVTETEVVAE